MAQDDPHFHWVVVIDDGLPDDIRGELAGVLEPFGPRASLCMQPPGPGGKLVEVARDQLGLDDDQPLLTGRLDDDDAWSTAMVRAVRAHANSWLKRPDRGPGITFTFQDGLEWIMYEMLDIDILMATGERLTHPPAVRDYSLPFIGTSVFVCCPISMGATSMSGAHSRVASHLAKARGFSTEVLPSTRPMWLCCRHKQAGSGIRKAQGGEVGTNLVELASQFGLDEEGVEHYLDHAHEHEYTLLKAPLDKKGKINRDLRQVVQRINDPSSSADELEQLKRHKGHLVAEMTQLEYDVLGNPDSIQSNDD